MNLKEELELKKAQEMKDEKRRASDGTFIVDEEYTVRDVENFIIDNIYKKKMEFLKKMRRSCVPYYWKSKKITSKSKKVT